MTEQFCALNQDNSKVPLIEFRLFIEKSTGKVSSSSFLVVF